MKCCNNLYENLFKVIIIISIVIIIIVTIGCCVSKNETPNVLTAIAVEGDNTAVGTTSIKFSTNELVEGNAISHTNGSDEIQINETGIYQISYQLYGERETFGTFNFAAVILVNNNAVESTFNDTPILRDNVINRMTLTSTIILKLNAGDALKLQGVSIEDIIYSRARIDIEKI